VDVVIDSAVRDPLELIIPSATTQFSQQHLNGSASDSQLSPLAIPASPSGSPAKSNGPTTSKQLRIEDRSYFTVSATAAVLHLLSDYLQVIVNLPMLTTDAMSKTIEFLKAFNSRTCQVVLGAGAMRSAGLKNITAKHLGQCLGVGSWVFPLTEASNAALASQSLSIMIALIPYVRETFRRHLSTKQAVILVEFDKLKRVSRPFSLQG
jgi:vacuolar protein sorting-associated protein 54